MSRTFISPSLLVYWHTKLLLLFLTKVVGHNLPKINGNKQVVSPDTIYNAIHVTLLHLPLHHSQCSQSIHSNHLHWIPTPFWLRMQNFKYSFIVHVIFTKYELISVSGIQDVRLSLSMNLCMFWETWQVDNLWCESLFKKYISF